MLEKNTDIKLEQSPDADKSTSPGENALIGSVFWPLWQRVAFRFCFAYLFLYLFPFPFSLIPGLHLVAIPWEWFVRPLIDCSSSYCFHVQPDWSSASSGSGDQLIRWIELATYAGVALVATLVWSIFDSRRKHYTLMLNLLRVWALTFVSANMLSYGAAKIFPSQFPQLSEHVLSQTVGTKSPMGMLWTFMSASQPYTIYTGFVEFSAGLMLAIPKTRVLGALLSMAVASQIVILNMCYDVPVKILSGHLLMLSVFLLVPDAKNLFAIFFQARQHLAFSCINLFRREKLNLIVWSAVWLFLAYYALSAAINSYQSVKSAAEKTARVGEYRGGWFIDSYQHNGQALPPAILDGQRWKSLWVYDKRIATRDFSDNWTSFKYTKAANGMDFDMVSKEDTSKKAHFSGQMPDAYTWILHGDIYGTPCELRLHRNNRNQYLLINRGFNWVNEVPFNR